MQDNIGPVDDDVTVPPGEQAEPSAVGKVVRWARFGAGARATIMLGLTVGAVVAVIPAHTSVTVSIV
jgi:hypothetical protein